MSDFNVALMSVMHHEGGLVNNAHDRGGMTKYGISIRFLQRIPSELGDLNGDGHVSKADIQCMTTDDARAIYQQFFWQHYRLNELAAQPIATKLFNCFVNMRGRTAALVAQRAANMLGAQLVEDGVMGSRSFKAINRLNPKHLMPCLQVQQWQVYQAIVRADPSQNEFINGWRKRAFSVI